MRLLSLPLASLLLAGQHHLPSVPRSVPRQLLTRVDTRHLQLLPLPRLLLTRLSSSSTSSSSPPRSFTVATPPPPPHTLEIKKSRFVAHLVPFEAHAGFLELQQRLKTEHPKASHVCYAYLGPGGVERSSDDGEPGGTSTVCCILIMKQPPPPAVNLDRSSFVPVAALPVGVLALPIDATALCPQSHLVTLAVD
jgi:hypothetical protein